MGEIRASVTLENRDDRGEVRRGLRAEADGVVDTGAVSLVIPDEIADCRRRTLAPRHPEGPVLAIR